MRRPAPRPLARALEATLGQAAPAGPLAQVQAIWAEVAGAAVAEHAQPVSERAGRVTVACSSAVWAQELALLAPELTARLNARPEVAGQVAELRFRTRAAGRA